APLVDPLRELRRARLDEVGESVDVPDERARDEWQGLPEPLELGVALVEDRLRALQPPLRSELVALGAGGLRRGARLLPEVVPLGLERDALLGEPPLRTLELGLAVVERRPGCP